MDMPKTRWLPLSLLAVLLGASGASAQVPDLSGLWAAKQRYGPDVRGPLIIAKTGTAWHADIAGFTVPVRVDGPTLVFELPDGKGSFRGKLSGRDIIGHWLLSSTATPVVLTPLRANQWRGVVTPLDNTFTLYLPFKRAGNNTYTTYLRNPERNAGRFIAVSRAEVHGDTVRLLGRRGNQPEGVIAEGRYRDGTINMLFGNESFDFKNVDDDSSNAYYTRGNPPERYRYHAPPQLDDGWPVARLEDVGIDRAAIEKFVQMLIELPLDSFRTSQIHSLLIVRQGKLVVEEYFHGYTRDIPHDTRSASKSWTAVLIGAAIHAGVPISLNTPVYQTMLGSLPADLDPRKRAMTLEHLISMTAGYDCNDSGDRPGDEDVMQQQAEERDWYKFTLAVPMRAAPGDTIVYCSIEPNLAGGVLAKLAKEPLAELFFRLVAQPLQMRNYHLFIQPNGEAYGGGGHRITPREFLKLAQLMLNDGKWNGKQITSVEWARQSTAALRQLTRTQRYGWLWNSLEYPYQGKTVRAFFAGGNGGQIFMAVPELDLLIGFTGGNYNDVPTLFIPQRVFVPEWILPAVR